MKFKVLSSKIIYDDYYKLIHQELQYDRFDGTQSNIIERDVIQRRDYIAILLFDPDRDEVILIEQFRPGISSKAYPWLIEIVAGTIDNKTDHPDDVALRESKEESGVECQRLEKITELFVTPGVSDEYMYLYIGKVDTTNAGGLYGLKEENEDIRAFVVSVNKALEMLAQGEIKSLPAYISLQWLKSNKDYLRKKWSLHENK